MIEYIKDCSFNTEVICPAQAGHFFEEHMDNFWEVNRVDGYTQEDLLRIMVDGDHVASFVNGKLVGVTKYEVNKKSAELHTYIKKEYRLMASSILKEHIRLVAEDNGCDVIYTATSNFNKEVFNFLRKRLGFQCYSVDLGIKNTRDGKPIYIYKMMLEL